MALIPVKFIDLKEPLFMNGNIGQKISLQTKSGLKMNYNTELRMLIIEYKGDISLLTNWNSFIPMSPADVGYNITTPPTTLSVNPSPFVGQGGQTSDLITQSRNAAMGIKNPVVNAQVSNPTKPAKGLTGLEGKAKIMSHAELKAQMAAEDKA